MIEHGVGSCGTGHRCGTGMCSVVPDDRTSRAKLRCRPEHVQGGDAWRRRTHDQQQELFVVVPARMAARTVAGLDFDEMIVPPDDADARKELLLLSPSILVPCLTHDGVQGLGHARDRRIPERDQARSRLAARRPAARAHCRAICGEMHSGFASLRSALPMNLKRAFPGHKVWARAQADIDRVTAIWRECLEHYGGPFLFGAAARMADAMYAPVVTRFLTYDVALDALRGLLRAHPRAARDAGMDRRRQARARRDRRARHGVLSRRSARTSPAVHGIGARAPRTGLHVDRLEVGRPHDLEVLHVRRIVEQVVRDARAAGARNRRRRPAFPCPRT